MLTNTSLTYLLGLQMFKVEESRDHWAGGEGMRKET